MASNHNHRSITFCSLLIICAINFVEANNVCLVSPFITSISSLEFSPTPPIVTVDNIPYKQYNISMNFQLDYKIDLNMRNLLLYVAKFPTDTDFLHLLDNLEFSNERTPSASGKGEIVYYQDKFDSSDREALKFTKDDYLRLMRKFYDLHSLATTKKRASEIANTCSKIYQYAADFMIKMDDHQLHHFIIHNQIVCKASLANKVSAPERLDGVSYEEFELNLASDIGLITAAKYQNKSLFILNPNGLLRIFFLDPNKQQSIESFLGPTASFEVYLYDRRLLSNNSTKRKTKCVPIIRQLRTSLPASVISDIMSSKPLVTLSRLNGTVFNAATQSNRSQVTTLIKDDESFKFGPLVDLGKLVQAPQNAVLSIEAIAIRELGENSNQASLVFYDAANNFTHFVTTNINHHWQVLGTAPNQERKQAGYVVPDDITYWAPCKKLISIYGFFYTMHDYGQDILNDESHWFMFDKDLFEYQIEAVHADGDKFKFILKTMTMITLTADSRNCDKLTFVGRGKRGHLRHLFEQEIGPSQLLYEGRYFDGHNWVPAWNDSSIYIAGKETEIGFNMTYVYILGGIAALLIVLTLLHIIRKYTAEQPAQHVAHTKIGISGTRGPSEVRKSPSRSPSSKPKSPQSPSVLTRLNKSVRSQLDMATNPDLKEHKTWTKFKPASPKTKKKTKTKTKSKSKSASPKHNLPSGAH